MAALLPTLTPRTDAHVQRNATSSTSADLAPEADVWRNASMKQKDLKDGAAIAPEREHCGVGAVGGRGLPITIEPSKAPHTAIVACSRTGVSPGPSVGPTADVDSGQPGHSSGSSLQAPRDPIGTPVKPTQSRWSKDDDLPPVPTSASSGQNVSGMFRRITTKLRSPLLPHASSSKGLSTSSPSAFPISSPVIQSTERKRGHSRSHALDDASQAADAPQPRPIKPKPTVYLPKAPAPSTLPNSFNSPQNRHAALARGLVPASSKNSRYRDAQGYMIPLSEQEKLLDKRYAVVVDDGRGESGEQQETEARRYKEEWLARNRSDRDQDQALLSSVEGWEEGTSALSNPKPTDALLESSDAGYDYSAIPDAAKVSPSSESLCQSMDFLPPHPARPGSTRRRSSDVSERVSRWLQSAMTSRSVSSSVSSSRERAPLLGLSHARKSSDKVAMPLASKDRIQYGERQGTDTFQGSGNRTQTPTDSPITRTPPQSRKQTSALPPSSFNLKGKREHLTPLIFRVPSRSSESRPGSRSSAALPQGEAPPISVSMTAPSPLSLGPGMLDPQSFQPRTPPRHRRGRSTTISDPQSQSSHELLSDTPESGYSSEGRGRSATLPALSPTRSASSCTPSEFGIPTTPTTFSHSGESHGHGHIRARHPTDYGLHLTKSSRGLLEAGKPGDRRAIHDSAEEEEDSSSDLHSYVNLEHDARMAGEAQKMRNLMAAVAASPRSRRPSQGADGPKPKTLGIFGKKSGGGEGIDHSDIDVGSAPFKSPRTSSSMQNLRRSVASTLSSLRRPKSTVDTSLSVPSNLAYFDASHLPPSPIFSASAYPSAAPPSAFPSALRRKVSQDPSLTTTTNPRRSSVGVGLRPRQALSPTIHNRGSILAETGRIENEESRRLSEMAFLDY